MAEIVPDSLQPFPHSVTPTIKFTVREVVQDSNILLKVDGLVYSDDGKFIANLIQTDLKPENTILKVVGISERVHTYQNVSYTAELMFTLDRRVVEYIEDQRHKNPKRNVIFRFDLNLTYLSHTLVVGDFKASRNDPKGDVVYSSYNNPSLSDMNLNLLTTGSNRNQLLSYRISKQGSITYTVRASDWIADFQSMLGLGKFMTIELPAADLDDKIVASMSTEQTKFNERLVRAHQILQHMELNVRVGEWGKVVQDSRDLLELFKKDMTQFIKKMISHTTSLQDEEAGELTESIDKLFAYASNLHHTVRQGQLKEVYTGGKEDAYLAFMISAGLVNLLSKKFRATLHDGS
jgi:hypothetical protein